MEREYSFPVFGTQGGGLVHETSPDNYVFIDVSDIPNSGYKVGDDMPQGWGVIAANDQALQAIEKELVDESDWEDPYLDQGDMLRGVHHE